MQDTYCVVSELCFRNGEKCLQTTKRKINVSEKYLSESRQKINPGEWSERFKLQQKGNVYFISGFFFF